MTVKKLVYKDGDALWIEIDRRPSYKSERPLHYSGKDPTVDQYISEKGAIFNHADKKYYTSKRSYMDSLKSMGKTIDDN